MDELDVDERWNVRVDEEWYVCEEWNVDDMLTVEKV